MELAQVVVFLLFYPLRQGAPTTYTSGAYTSGTYTSGAYTSGEPRRTGNTHPPTGSWTYTTSPVPLTTTEEVKRTTYPPSSEPWYLSDDEEIVTDWVEVNWDTWNSEDAHDAFDDEINTSFTLDPIIYGNVVKLNAVFYWPTVNVKGVRIVVDQRTDEDTITVELDPDFTDLFHSTLYPRTVCLLVSSNPSWKGVKTLEYKCDRVSATRLWIIFKHQGGPDTVVYDVYMYGYSSRPEVNTYRKFGSEGPSEEAWVLADDEEIVTDWVKFRWGDWNEKDAYRAFDDNMETSITLEAAIHRRVAKLYAVFYYQVNVNGVRIVVDQWTDEDTITVEIDPEFTDFTATPRPRTVCPLKDSVSESGLKQVRFKCDRITTARVWVIFEIPGGHSTVVHDVYMYGNSLSEYVTYEKEEEGTEFVTGMEEITTKYWMRTLSSTSYSQWTSGKDNSESTESVTSGPTTSWPYFHFSDVFSLFQKEDHNDYFTWQPDFEDFIPYEKLVEQQEKKVEKQLKSEGEGGEEGEEEEADKGSNVLGFLTNTGYLDYVMTGNKVEDKVNEAKKTAKKDSDKKKDTGLLVDSNDVKNSIKVFQKFNGFPETGTLDRDILEFVKKPRCGNHDVEYTEEEVKQEALLCDTAFSGSKPVQTTNFDCEGFNGAGSETKCVNLPAVSKTGFIEEGVPYTIEIDLQFKPQEGGSWEDLKNKFHIFFNYDSIDELKFLDRINLFAEDDKFGFLYDKKKAGKDKTLGDYDMTKTQIARREFKIRIDVEKNKEAFLLINGNDVGKIKYKRRLKPSVRLQWQDKIPGIITARICKRPETVEVSRTKRSASSHIWGDNLITFNFQNYSSSLGEKDTRKGVMDALKILGTSAKLEFKEISALDSAMVTYMFIKGRHADGMTFSGAGIEKAHAFSPVHSEVHFNDFEKFTLEMEDRATSMFYVALHETGHALGMKHSAYKDAVMAAGYVPLKAYQTNSLHRTDKQVLHASYLGDIPEQAKVIELDPAKRIIPDPDLYLPKFPLPRDCFDKIDAAFTFGPTLYLISNTFIWQYQKEGAGYKMIGGPQGVSNVLAGWNHITRAAFTVGDKLYILGDGVAHRYSRYSTIWVLKTVSTVDELLNSKKSSHNFGAVKSAFSLQLDGGVVQTTLVTGTQEYYKITWKNSNKVATADWFQDSSGTELLGKTYGLTEFNAATTHEREKKGAKFTEVMKFDGKYVKSVKVYHNSGEVVRKKDPYFEIPVAFQIPKWCAPKLNG